MNSAVKFGSLIAGGALCIALLAGGVTQEVPRGNLSGLVVMSENGKPLQKASVTLMVKHDLGPDEKAYRTFETDENGRFQLRNIVAGLYSIRADGRAHNSKERLITVEEGKDISVDLSLKPAAPYLELYASQRVFTPAKQASFTLSGFEPSKVASVEYYKLDLGKISAKQSLKDLLYSFSRPGSNANPEKASTSQASFKKDILSKDYEGVFTEPITMPKLDEGFYYVECKVGNLSRSTYINVSKIGLVTKSDKKSALCYVSDIESGKPIAGAQIQLPKAETLATVGSTDVNGIFQAARGDSKDLVVAKYGKSVGVVDVDLYEGESDGKNKIVMYTDRPIYRPGDTVQFKGIIRKFDGTNYSVPGAGTAEVTVLDANENPVEKMTVPVSARGSFTGSYTSNREDAPGGYAFKVDYGDTDYRYWFSLAAYRKPDFSIKVEPQKSFYIYGDTASAKIKCEYYFGGPVVGAKVDAYVSRSYKFDYGDDEEEDYGSDYYPQGMSGEFSQQIQVVTDEKGEALIEFPTRGEGDTEAPTMDYNYTVSASVTDGNGKYFDGQGDVSVVRGDIGLNLTLDDYVAAADTNASATIQVTDQQTGKPLSDQDVVVQVGSEEWKGDEAIFHPRSEIRAARTDAKGESTIIIPTGSEGSLRLRAVARDRSGHEVVQESYLYVEGENMVGPPTAHFTVTLNKRRYKVGDICEALIQTSVTGGSALVTVEADHILSQQVVALDKPAITIKIPVTRQFAPNVYVAACSVSNMRLNEASSKLVVTIPEHKLNVEVTPDQPDYKPGDTATITVKTTNANGQATPSEVSVGVVDESIYAIQEDHTNLERDLYPMRSNGVVTSYSFEEIYLDGGDKGGGNVPIRSVFKDTADWQPVVQTDESGVARVSLKLPDNLTTWRATAVGVTDQTQVGKGVAKFRVRKPVMVRLSLPAFLVEGDVQTVTASITNDTGSDQQINVRLDAQGVDVEGSNSQRVTVTTSRPYNMSWTVTAKDPGTARFTAYATIDGGANDAEDRSIEIKPFGLERVENQAGSIRGSKELTFEVSPDASTHSGRLRLSLSPTIAGSIYQSLDQFIDFPYGCVEQTMSRFLPSVLLSSSLKEAGPEGAKWRDKIRAIAEDGFARLAAMKHSDGAWGWWTYDESDPFMTAYVLDGLDRAKTAGYTTTKIDTGNAVTWMKSVISKPPAKREEVYSYLYLLYVASRYGLADEAKAALEKTPELSGTAEWALSALTAEAAGDHVDAVRRLNKVDDILNTGDLEERQGKHNSAYGAELLAWPLLAHVTIGRDMLASQGLVKQLMDARKSEFWYSTRDSSITIMALTQYLKLTNEIGRTFEATLSLNGKPYKKLHFDPASIFDLDQKIEVPLSELNSGTNRLSVEVSGNGSLYYSANLRQVVRQPKIAADGAPSLNISRAYYRLETQRLEDGSQRLLPSKQPTTQFNTGDLIQVELTVNSSIDREFMMVEDPIPSNCRVTDREYVDEGSEWNYWWSQLIIRDDRVAFFMRDEDKGRQVLTYTMRAEQPGKVRALPPTIANMYDPAQAAHGASGTFEVRR